MKVFIEKIQNYDLDKIYDFLRKTTTEIKLWEKLENKTKILIKPNLLGAFKPEKAVTTHPIILEALIRLLKKNNKEIWLGDSPGGSISVKKVFLETGMKTLAEKYEIKLVNFSEGGVLLKKSGNTEFPITKYLWEADAIINVGKYKTHSLMYYTGCVKNLYGVIPGLKKSDYHKYHPDFKDFAGIITSLFSIVKGRISFNILDGILGMEGEGPSAGIPRNFGILFASESASAVDYQASKMMGYSLKQLPYINEFLEVENLSQDDINVDKEWDSFVFENVKIRQVGFLINLINKTPGFIKNFLTKYYKYYPDFNENCTLCKVCVQSCPVKAMKIVEDIPHPVIDYDNCIKCMCCHELCPQQAVYVKKSFLAKLLIK